MTKVTIFEESASVPEAVFKEIPVQLDAPPAVKDPDAEVTVGDLRATGVFTLPGASVEAPQAIVTIIPDAAPVVQNGVGIDDNVPVVLQDNATVGVSEAAPDPVDANGSPVVELSSDRFLVEDMVELERLQQRCVQEPTSERARQELLSFKSLKGIA